MFHHAVPEQVTGAIAAMAGGQRAGSKPDPAGAPPAVGREDRPAA